MNAVNTITEMSVELSLIATSVISPIPGAFRLISQWLGV